jgi:hypothetical protein
VTEAHKALLDRMERHLQAIAAYAESTGDAQQMRMVARAYGKARREFERALRSGRTDWAAVHRFMAAIEAAYARTQEKYQ